MGIKAGVAVVAQHKQFVRRYRLGSPLIQRRFGNVRFIQGRAVNPDQTIPDFNLLTWEANYPFDHQKFFVGIAILPGVGGEHKKTTTSPVWGW